jgi:REP element-mobilizing transposase RayT
MVRGLERRAIFRDDTDRADFVARMEVLAEAGYWTIYAWALLPNHAHLLVRTGTRPLPRSMRSLLTGYAGAFNRRHKRVGHLFQNRYKSIVVEEEPYLLELVRYLHLNPIRAKVVPGLRQLSRYPWTGHSALLGTIPRPWQDTGTILAQFGPTPTRARRAYDEFVTAGLPRGRRPELQGGGLVRSVGGWGELVALRRAKAAVAGDARVLGDGTFVERVWRETQAAQPTALARLSLHSVIARVCRQTGTTPMEVAGGGQRTAVIRAREGIAHLWIAVLGQSGRRLAPVLGVAPQSVYRAAARGAAQATEWGAILDR